MEPEELQRVVRTDIQTELDPTLVSRITSQAPFVSVPGICNLRDISNASFFGFASTIRPGIAYRSGMLPTTVSTEAHVNLVQTLGITTIFDLRGPIERIKAPSPDIEGIENVWLPYAFEAPPPNFADFVGSDSAASFAKTYQNILNTHVPIFKRVFEHIRDRPRDPFLFHCSGGKDRTGVLAALIHRLAGTSDAAIVHDYMLTRVGIESARPALMALFNKHIGEENLEHMGMIALLGVHEQSIEGFLQTLDEMGGAQHYLHQQLGISEGDVKVIQENLRQ
ncbi:hypothetical protein BBP40_009987 [Aspergillus hancockii]|nr:hypothetical protein BBP40_009987 [Aspergillus hancockii]